MKLNTFTRSGPGGAHIGFRMFGARGPLLDEHDSGGGGGGTGAGGEGAQGSADEKKPDEGGSGGSEKLHTADDVERIVQERLRRDRRERGSEPKPPDKKPDRKNSKADSGDARWLYEFQDALDDVSEELGVKPGRDLKTRLRDNFERERPDDPYAWVKGWFSAVGLKKPDTQNTQQQQQQKTGEGDVSQQKKPDGPTISDKGGAGGAPVDFEAKLNERPLELTKLEIDRLQQKHGEEKANAMIRDAVNRKLRGMKLIADPKRKTH